MKEPEPVPCRMCGTAIYPGLDFCGDECERAMHEEMYREEMNRETMNRWIQENGEHGHG